MEALFRVSTIFLHISSIDRSKMKKPTHNINRKPKLAVFDIEGVLVPRNRLFFDIASDLGIARIISVLFYGFLYEAGLIPINVALKKIFWFLRGATINLFEEKLDALPLMPNALEVFRVLKSEGCIVVLISSSFPTFLVEKMVARLGADYGFGVEVDLNGQILTGKVWGKVIKSKGKYLILDQLLVKEHLAAADCVIIADDRNNSSIFLKKALKIGYNPDFILRIKADFVVTGQLIKILPIIRGEIGRKRFPSINDFTREIIHASGIFMSILAMAVGILHVAAFIVSVLILYCIAEISRIKGKSLPVFTKVTEYVASQSELCEFTFAPVYYALGILLTLLLFPAPVSYAAIAVFTLGDSTASLIGGTITGHSLPFNGAKSLEGSLAGFLFAFLAACVFVSPWFALIGASVGMFVEYLPLPINDNFLIPLVTGLVLTLV
jgi:phosphoserine phosphatase